MVPWAISIFEIMRHKFENFTVTTNDHRYILFVVITIRIFPHSWHINGYVTRLTRLVATSRTGTAYPSRVPEFTPNFKRSSCCSTFNFLCTVVFCRSLLVLCPFSFGHCIVYPSPIYSFFKLFVLFIIFIFNKHFKYQKCFSQRIKFAGFI